MVCSQSYAALFYPFYSPDCSQICTMVNVEWCLNDVCANGKYFWKKTLKILQNLSGVGGTWKSVCLEGGGSWKKGSSSRYVLHLWPGVPRSLENLVKVWNLQIPFKGLEKVLNFTKMSNYSWILQKLTNSFKLQFLWLDVLWGNSFQWSCSSRLVWKIQILCQENVLNFVVRKRVGTLFYCRWSLLMYSKRVMWLVWREI